MEENLKRNLNLISLQHGALNFAAISLDDRWPRNETEDVLGCLQEPIIASWCLKSSKIRHGIFFFGGGGTF